MCLCLRIIRASSQDVYLVCSTLIKFLPSSLKRFTFDLENIQPSFFLRKSGSAVFQNKAITRWSQMKCPPNFSKLASYTRLMKNNLNFLRQTDGGF